VNAGLAAPVRGGRGPVKVAIRATARVRSSVGVFVAGERVGDVLVRPGPWDVYGVEFPAERIRGGSLALSLALTPLPLVRGSHVDDPGILVDFVDVISDGGLRLSLRSAAVAGAVAAAVVAFASIIGLGLGPGLAAGAAAGGLGLMLLDRAPVAFMAGAPRLVPIALFAGIAVHRLLRRASPAQPADRATLALLTAAGMLFHGSLVFFPDHSPPDIDIHARRTFDLAGVPWDYQALLRYGSQLPTASQDQGSATAALGEKTLIPYSPLPYLFYFALHGVGLDLYWAMTVANALLAMLVTPWLWVVAARTWDRGTAWLAALLYATDLAVWHHLGRSHAPAVFGAALGTAALLYLVAEAPRLESRSRVFRAGAVLGIAVLGYSSAVVLVGLFGLVLLAALSLDARGLTAGARRGLAAALVVGGLLAGGLFYFHYLPGLVSGARGVEAEPDLFPGRTFLIFHNESRQSLRIWILGFWIPLGAGLLALPFAVRRASPSSRPILLSWAAAWAGIMLLKEPFLFPKLLRWAKEDQFVSPLLCLTIAAAVWGLPRAWMRWAGTALALSTALWLQLRDFGHHASSLRL
jgi:hypothetical protein